jgi:hypothetical protein
LAAARRAETLSKLTTCNANSRMSTKKCNVSAKFGQAYLPNSLEVVRAHVLVVKVVGVFPDVNSEEGDKSGGAERILVGTGLDSDAVRCLERGCIVRLQSVSLCRGTVPCHSPTSPSQSPEQRRCHR